MALTAVLRTTTHNVAARSAEEHKRSSAQRTLLLSNGRPSSNPECVHKINVFRELLKARCRYPSSDAPPTELEFQEHSSRWCVSSDIATEEQCSDSRCLWLCRSAGARSASSEWGVAHLDTGILAPRSSLVEDEVLVRMSLAEQLRSADM
jgi:hypothetical protein